MQTPEEFTSTLAGCDIPEAIKADFLAELARLEAESIGWIPLDDGAYLHVGSEDGVVEIVGFADAGMAGANVLCIP
jgi:hypothetical protein